MLGVCLGHQLIVDVCGGAVKRTKLEAGLKEISILKHHKIFDNLNPEFFAFHHDEAISLPNNLELLASSKDCKIHAVAHKSSPVIGVQFHPEFTKDIWEWVTKLTHREDLLNESKNYDMRNSEIFFKNLLRWANEHQ